MMINQSQNALLCLWNDIEEHRIEEYDRWHTLEHVSERVWVPGFVSGTRYSAAITSQTRYFTLYELSDLNCLHSREYQDLVDNPTPWSASMRPSFSNFLRKTGFVIAKTGNVSGSAMLVVRWVWPKEAAVSHAQFQRIADHILQAGSSFGISRVRIQKAETSGPQAMGNVDNAPVGIEYIGLIETYEPDHLIRISELLESAEYSAWSVAPVWRNIGGYRFVSRVQHNDILSTTRPVPSLDLMSI